MTTKTTATVPVPLTTARGLWERTTEDVADEAKLDKAQRAAFAAAAASLWTDSLEPACTESGVVVVAAAAATASADAADAQTQPLQAANDIAALREAVRAYRRAVPSALRAKLGAEASIELRAKTRPAEAAAETETEMLDEDPSDVALVADAEARLAATRQAFTAAQTRLLPLLARAERVSAIVHSASQ